MRAVITFTEQRYRFYNLFRNILKLFFVFIVKYIEYMHHRYSLNHLLLKSISYEIKYKRIFLIIDLYSNLE